MNKVSFFVNGVGTGKDCIAYDKSIEPVLNGRGGFGQPMRLIVMIAGGKYIIEEVLVTWLDVYYAQEVDKQFVIENSPELITYLRKNKIAYE